MSSANDWSRELDAAAGWIAGQFARAANVAFPPGSLFGATAARLVSPELMREFRKALVDDLHERWTSSGVPWRRGEPLHGEMMRRVGVEGRFAHASIVHAARFIGADEVLDELPDGLAVVINPGYLWTKCSHKDRGTRIEVPGEGGTDGG